jgi:hypothetical protein
MGMWDNRRDRAFGRRLRAERPRAGEQLVRMLAERVSAEGVGARRPERRRSVLPRVIVIATVTVSVAVALGATGAVSYAGGSLHSLSTNLVHVVSPPVAPVVPFTTAGAASVKSIGAGLGSGGSRGQGSGGGGQGSSGSGGQDNGSAGSGILGGGGLGGNLGLGVGDPFNSQYGLQIPTCQGGQLVFVSLDTYIYLLLHGDPPAIGIFCSSRG